MFRTILLVMVALATSVFAQRQRLYVVTYIDVFPMYAADTVKILQQLSNDSKKDAGFVRFEVLKDVERANHMTIVEVWQNREAYEKH
jgi:quinol monooxygenase YgiN